MSDAWAGDGDDAMAIAVPEEEGGGEGAGGAEGAGAVENAAGEGAAPAAHDVEVEGNALLEALREADAVEILVGIASRSGARESWEEYDEHGGACLADHEKNARLLIWQLAGSSSQARHEAVELGVPSDSLAGLSLLGCLPMPVPPALERYQRTLSDELKSTSAATCAGIHRSLSPDARPDAGATCARTISAATCAALVSIVACRHGLICAL